MIICIIIGVVLALIISLVLKGQLKTVHQENSAASYIEEGSFQLSEEWDTFLYERVTRTEKPRNDEKIQ